MCVGQLWSVKILSKVEFGHGHEGINRPNSPLVFRHKSRKMAYRGRYGRRSGLRSGRRFARRGRNTARRSSYGRRGYRSGRRGRRSYARRPKMYKMISPYQHKKDTIRPAHQTNDNTWANISVGGSTPNTFILFSPTARQRNGPVGAGFFPSLDYGRSSKETLQGELFTRTEPLSSSS